MIKALITYFFFIIPFLNFSQDEVIDEKYKNETKNLLSDIIYEMKIDIKTVVINKPTTHALKDCFKTLYINSNELTEDEKLIIKEKIENPNNFEWTKDYFEDIKIVEYSKYQKVFKNEKNGWKNFRKKYGDTILMFSKPIFLRDYSICIISYSNTTDYLGGYGSTGFYKKENGKWKDYGWACEWNI